MRIVATSDTHYPPEIKRLNGMLATVWEPTIEIPDGDVFIHAGDLMRNGYPDEWPPLLEWLARLPHKHKFYVPGNHDFHLQVYPGPALQQLRQIGVTVIGLPDNPHFASAKLPNGMSMLGLPFVTNMKRWAFNINKADLVEYMKRIWLAQEHDVIVSHVPVHGLLDLAYNGENAGSMLYRNYLETRNPKVWICGHIHEGYGSVVHNQTRVYNVAMCNRDYKHSNPPVVIDF